MIFFLFMLGFFFIEFSALTFTLSNSNFGNSIKLLNEFFSKQKHIRMAKNEKKHFENNINIYVSLKRVF